MFMIMPRLPFGMHEVVLTMKEDVKNVKTLIYFMKKGILLQDKAHKKRI